MTLPEKVLWKDGLPINEKHFHAFEAWIEGRLAWWLRTSGKVGLVRRPREPHNMQDMLVVVDPSSEQLALEVNDLKLISETGSLVEVNGPARTKLEIVSKPKDRSLAVFLVLGGEKSYSGELSENPVLYQRDWSLVTELGDRDGLCIGKLKETDHGWEIDSDYLPPCCTVTSCDAFQRRWSAVIRKCRQVQQLADEKFIAYLEQSKADNPAIVLVEVARMVRDRLANWLLMVDDPSLDPASFVSSAREIVALNEALARFSTLMGFESAQHKESKFHNCLSEVEWATTHLVTSCSQLLNLSLSEGNSLDFVDCKIIASEPWTKVEIELVKECLSEEKALIQGWVKLNRINLNLDVRVTTDPEKKAAEIDPIKLRSMESGWYSFDYKIKTVQTPRLFLFFKKGILPEQEPCEGWLKFSNLG